MSKNLDYIIQIMEKIGAPLITAANDVQVRKSMMAAAGNPQQPMADNPQQDAQDMSALLGKSTDLALTIAQGMGLPDDQKQADSIRLALTSLVGPILANQYRTSSHLPTDAETKRISGALDVIMSFSDGFQSAGDAQIRLDQMDKDFFPTDPAQIQILYMQALVPTLNAVVTFPFGQPERKLLHDVVDRLIKKSSELRHAYFGQLTDQQAKKAELAIMRALSTIYGQCHFSEMARIMNLPPEQQQSSIDQVWQAFDTRIALIDILVQVTAGQSQSASSAGAMTPDQAAQMPQQPMMQQPPMQQQPSMAPPPMQQVPVQQENVPPADTGMPQQPPAQPMTQQPQQPPSIFSDAPPAQDHAQVPSQTQQPPVAPPAQPPAAPPPPPPPAQETVDNSSGDQNGDGDSGNPMSFFT